MNEFSCSPNRRKERVGRHCFLPFQARRSYVPLLPTQLVSMYPSTKLSAYMQHRASSVNILTQSLVCTHDTEPHPHTHDTEPCLHTHDTETHLHIFQHIASSITSHTEPCLCTYDTEPHPWTSWHRPLSVCLICVPRQCTPQCTAYFAQSLPVDLMVYIVVNVQLYCIEVQI